MNILLLAKDSKKSNVIFDYFKKNNFQISLVKISDFRKNQQIILKKINQLLKQNITIINFFGETRDKKLMNDYNFVFVMEIINLLNKKKINYHLIHISTLSILKRQNANYFRHNIYENTQNTLETKYQITKKKAEEFIINKSKSGKYTILRIGSLYMLNDNNFWLVKLVEYFSKKKLLILNFKNTYLGILTIDDLCINLIRLTKNKKNKNSTFNLTDNINLYELLEKIFNTNNIIYHKFYIPNPILYFSLSLIQLFKLFGFQKFSNIYNVLFSNNYYVCKKILNNNRFEFNNSFYKYFLSKKHD